jgi:hypothetical protein
MVWWSAPLPDDSAVSEIWCSMYRFRLRHCKQFSKCYSTNQQLLEPSGLLVSCRWKVAMDRTWTACSPAIWWAYWWTVSHGSTSMWMVWTTAWLRVTFLLCATQSWTYTASVKRCGQSTFCLTRCGGGGGLRGFHTASVPSIRTCLPSRFHHFIIHADSRIEVALVITVACNTLKRTNG